MNISKNELLTFKVKPRDIFGMMDDPFSHDPFFSDNGFGRMDKMMKDMRKQMKMDMSSLQ